MLQQGNTGRDIDGMRQVVAAAKDGGTRLLVILREQMLQHVLAGGVEEVERLVQNDNLRTVEESCHDAHLLLVAGREVADEFLLAEHLASGEALKVLQALVNLCLRLARHLAQKGKVFLGCQEVDEEPLVDIGPHDVLPLLAFGRIDAVDGYCSFVSFQQVEHDAEERTFTGSVVAYESKDIAVVNGKRGDIAGNSLSEILLEIANGNHNSLLGLKQFRVRDSS